MGPGISVDVFGERQKFLVPAGFDLQVIQIVATTTTDVPDPIIYKYNILNECFEVLQPSVSVFPTNHGNFRNISLRLPYIQAEM